MLIFLGLGDACVNSSDCHDVDHAECIRDKCTCSQGYKKYGIVCITGMMFHISTYVIYVNYDSFQLMLWLLKRSSNGVQRNWKPKTHVHFLFVIYNFWKFRAQINNYAKTI
jgi:uncharacterized membrane protein